MAAQTAYDAAWANVVETGANVPPDPASAVVPADQPMAPVEDGADGELSQDDAPEEVPPGELEPSSDEETAAAPDEVEEESAAQPTSRERRIQRFSDLTRERDAAREREKFAAEREKFAAEQADFWRQRALAGETRPAETPAAPSDGVVRDAQTGEPQFPLEEHYATTAEYHAAMQRFREADRQWVVQQAERQILQRLDDQTAERQIRQQYPDYEEVLHRSQVRLNDHVTMALLASPQKHALFYHFAIHPEEAARFAPLTGAQAFLAIGELQAQLRQAPPAAAPSPPATGAPAPPAPALPTTSQAPPPISPARGAAARPPVSDDELPLSDFFAKRNKEERAVQWR